MDRIMVYEPFVAEEKFCDECGYTTPHMIQFSEYVSKSHSVIFFLYCAECYSRNGLNTMCYRITISTSDWMRLIKSSRPDN